MTNDKRESGLALLCTFNLETLLCISSSYFHPNGPWHVIFFFFWMGGNLISWKVYFIGPDKKIKPQLSRGFYKRCTLWFELETYYADLEPFVIMLRFLETITCNHFPYNLPTIFFNLNFIGWKTWTNFRIAILSLYFRFNLKTKYSYKCDD
jgi:hypothetical protein